MTGSANGTRLEGLRVLVVDDDPTIRVLLIRHIREAGGWGVGCGSAREGMRALLQEEIDAVILDLRLGDMDGTTFLREARKIWPWLEVLVLSGYLDEESTEALAELGVTQFFHKPPNIRELLASLQTIRDSRTSAPGGGDGGAVGQLRLPFKLFGALGEALLQSQHFAGAIEHLAAELFSMMACDAVGMLDLEPAGAVLFVQGQQPLSPAVSECIEQELLHQAEMLGGRKIDPSTLDRRFHNPSREGDTVLDCPSMFSVPVLLGNELMGLLLFAAVRPNAFSRVEVSMAYHAAYQLSLLFAAFRRIRHLSIRDDLTGLYNRRYLRDVGPQLWAMHSRHGSPLSLAMLDIDHFKGVNDRCGHSVGDRLLRQFAERLKAMMRASDMVVRYGGDEFILLMPHTDAAAAAALAQRMLVSLRDGAFEQGGHAIHMPTSIGLAVSVGGGPLNDFFTLIDRADEALFEAKRQGRLRVGTWRGRGDIVIQQPESERAPLPSPAPGGAPSRGRILVIDDDRPVCESITLMLERLGGYTTRYCCSAKEALELLRADAEGFAVALIDLMLPGEDGFELLMHLRQHFPELIRIVITGYASMENAMKALREHTFDFIRKPIQFEQLDMAIVRALKYREALVENRRYERDLEATVQQRNAELAAALGQMRRTYAQTIEALAAMVDLREFETGQHSKRVYQMTQVIGRELGLADHDLEQIGYGALLHDIGKMAVPDAILKKEDPLLHEEWAVIRRHPEIGYRFLISVPFLHDVAEMVYEHHEHYDGTGYPRGLQGEAICLGARLFAVVDAYDAMLSPRGYRKSFDAQQALLEIRKQRGLQFDPAIVDAFVRCHERMVLLLSCAAPEGPAEVPRP